MKAKFFFLGLCALALAACSLDEVSQVNDTNAVTFKATTATRAAATTTNNIANFSVWAWNTVDGVTNEFMDDVIASRSGSSNTFTTSPLYFWPTGSVDFYAVSPATELYGVETDSYGNQTEYAYFGGELSEGDDEDSSWTYSGYVAKAQIENDNIVFDVTIPSKAEDQIDLCYAINKGQTSGGVAMNFRHALSQVVFKAKNVNEDFVVDIAGISVCSVFKTGTYTLKGVEPTTGDITDDSKGVWDYENEGHKARFAAGITATTLDYNEGETVEIMADGGALMLLPQEVEKWDVYADLTDSALGSYIAVLCRVTEHGSLLWPNANEEGNTELVDGVEYAYIAMPVDVEWEEGYRYTYTIIFGEGLGYYPPDDDNFNLEGTPVLVPITFDVTVDEFQDTEGVEVTTNTDVVVYNATDLLAAWNRGLSPIEIAADITLDEDLVLSSGATMDIIIDEGCTLYRNNEDDDSGDYCYVFHVEDGTLNVYGDGAVKCTLDESTGGTGFYAVRVHGTDAVANIYGCTFQGYPDCVYVREGTANIYGGTYYSTEKYNDRYWLLNCQNAAWKDGTAHIYVYGGTYCEFDPSDPNVDDADTYVASGYGVTTSVDDDGNTWYTVVYTTVATPADLYAAVDAGASEITLDADVTLESHDLFFYDDCELNLNGHTLIGVDVADDEDCSGANSVIFVEGGTLTVNGPGTITTEGSGTDGQGGTGSGDTSIFWLQGGELIINGGTYNGGSWKDTTGEEYTASSATVYVQSGFAYIYDGTFTCGVANAFKSEGWKTAEGYTESIINIYDAARNTNPKTGWAYVYGGTYRNFDPGNNPCEGANTDFCAEGYASDDGVVDADGNTWFTVSKTN